MQSKTAYFILGIIIYWLLFRLATFLFEQYLIYIRGPVLPILLAEHTLLPLVFGYYWFREYSKIYNSTPLIALVMPATTISIATIWDIMGGKDVTVYKHTVLFLIVVSLQLIFVVAGSFLQKKLKN